MAASAPPATPTPVVLRKPRRLKPVGLSSTTGRSLIWGTSFARSYLWDGSEKVNIFIRLRHALSSGIWPLPVKCRHAPRRADPPGGRRRGRAVHRQSRMAPDRCTSAGQCFTRSTPLLCLLRRVPRRGRPRFMAREAVPVTSRRPVRLPTNRGPLGSVSLRHHQEWWGGDRTARDAGVRRSAFG